MNPRRLAVIGGGFAGLAAAHRLVERARDIDVTLYEACPDLGGVARTEQQGDFLIEHGADMFTTRDPWAVDLCRRIGFEHELIGTNRQHARAFVVRGSRLFPVPEGFTLMTPSRLWPLVTSPLIGIGGKIRMMGEYFVAARRDEADESLASFTRRRFGGEAFDRLIQPLISGIYTADPEKLSMRAALPQIVEMEQQHGGLIRAMRKAGDRTGDRQADSQGSGARYGLFVAPRRGMQSFVEAIAQKLPAGTIRTATRVTRLERDANEGWKLWVPGADAPERFDGVIVAIPAPGAAELLAAASPPLAAELRAIPYATAAIIVLAYRREKVQRIPRGFGVVVPLIEKRRLIAASFSSMKFAGRAPEDHVLIRVFVGGACQPQLAGLDDEPLQALAREELESLIGVEGPPVIARVIRWKEAMPQYHVGHLDRVACIERLAAELPALELAGNAYRGVGIPQCIHSGEQSADRMLDAVRAGRG